MYWSLRNKLTRSYLRPNKGMYFQLYPFSTVNFHSFEFFHISIRFQPIARRKSYEIRHTAFKLSTYSHTREIPRLYYITLYFRGQKFLYSFSGKRRGFCSFSFRTFESAPLDLRDYAAASSTRFPSRDILFRGCISTGNLQEEGRKTIGCSMIWFTSCSENSGSKKRINCNTKWWLRYILKLFYN